MQGLIDIEPKQFLDFHAEENKIAQAQLTVINLTKQVLTFKIKTTTPNLFQVKPSVGVIEPNQQVIVDISTTQIFREGHKLDSKFQINATHCETEDQDLTQFWRVRDTQLIQSVQVKSRLKQIQQNPPAEEFQDVQKVEQPVQQEIIESSILSNDPKLYQSIMDNSKDREEEIQKYQEQLEKLQKEYSDYQVMLNSLKQQQVAVKEHGINNSYQANKFDLKHVAIIVAISFILGFLFGK